MWVIAALQDRIIPKNLWPPRLPDVTLQISVFGATCRRQCTGKNLTIEAIKGNIQLEIANIENMFCSEEWTTYMMSGSV
jgi:hypothetical protein